MKRKLKCKRVHCIVIQLLVMGAPVVERVFWDKAEARVYFEKHHQSVCCYPLVTVDGVEKKNLLAARKFFGVKCDSSIPPFSRMG